jgi:hypothetical protein
MTSNKVIQITKNIGITAFCVGTIIVGKKYYLGLKEFITFNKK